MAAVVALDAFQAVPFCYLRYLKRPLKFAALKLSFIALNILLNLLYFVVLPHVVPSWQIEVGHVFFVNLICTGLITFGFGRALWRALAHGPLARSVQCCLTLGPCWCLALQAF